MSGKTDDLDDLELQERDPGDGNDSGAPAWDSGEPDPAGDRELASSSYRDDFEQLQPQPKRPWLVSLIGLVVAALVGWWWLSREQATDATPEPEPARAVEQTAPIPEATEPELPFVLPELSASDEVVAGLVRELSSHPQLVAWTVNEDLARRFVASVANLAEGVSPKVHLGFLDPGGSFEVSEDGGQPTIDPRTYRRYDLATQVFSSLDTEGSAEIYAKLRPLFDEAWAELGMPAQSFDEVLAGAVRQLLDAPVVEGEVALSPRVTSFEFADPALENLSSAQKQLLRMGPENVERVQAKLREIALAIGLPI